MPSILHRAMLAVGVLLLSFAGPVSAAGSGPATFASRDLGRAARVTPVGGKVRLADVQAELGEPASLLLERFAVFADDAEIVVHEDGGETVLPAPANVYFRGSVEGEPGSRVFLAVLADGTAEGIVTRTEDTYLIGGDDVPVKALGRQPLEMRRVEPVLLKAARGDAFACGNSQLPQNPHPLEELVLGTASPALAKATTAALPAHTARIAVETDYEYYTKFNNPTNATNYVGNLLGYASTIYANEINTSLLVQSVSLWTTSSDPWTQGNTVCGLMEFGRYWNLNKQGVSRTIAHFLSGRSLGGGVAWLGVLCAGSFGASASCPGLPTDAPWGGGYGFTASINGTFNINNPTVMWDIMAVAHEIGHNFNSPHSHCYNGLGGSSSPIDQCYSGEAGCYSGPSASLPGPAGAGSGTIMSYCHLVRGSYSDISLKFGTGHPYGVQPGREAARMSSYVGSVASGNPSCLAYSGSGGGAAAAAPADFDGNGVSDTVIHHSGAWQFFKLSTAAFDHGVWTGASGACIPAPADYDGDGNVDFAQKCGGAWHFYNDNGTYLKGIWTGGVAGDLPVPADYDGDGDADVVVFRNGAWMFYNYANGAITGSTWTGPGAGVIPLPMDYDGDGTADFSIYQNGSWHFYNDNGTYNKGIWTGGVAGDVPVPGDFNGDGREEPVIFRGGAWLFFNFTTGAYDHGVWTGSATYQGRPLQPAPLDYDGDGTMDFTVYAGGPWHFFQDNGTYLKGIWTGGVAGDKPISRRQLSQ
jgi:metallopeptidase family M12-like protein/VCBS repeat protein